MAFKALVILVAYCLYCKHIFLPPFQQQYKHLLENRLYEKLTSLYLRSYSNFRIFRHAEVCFVCHFLSSLVEFNSAFLLFLLHCGIYPQ
ncbi:hypothetical protein T09_5737 [Trichinella sp. T9]|nr:hypothetical protein T09_5737 [Trichinella sp. T9]